MNLDASDMTSQLVMYFQEKREQVIRQALSSYGITFDYHKKKRFNSLMSITQGEYEYIYYNDGTDNGLFLCGFRLKTDFNLDSPLNISYDIIFDEPEFLKIK